MFNSKLEEAIKILINGGIVIYPTDTAFGIGCRMDNPKSVEKLFAIRNRPRSQAAPVLVGSIAMAQKYYLSPLPDNVRQLMEKYWPGALTIVYNCRQEVIPPLVCGNGATIGLRMPNHEVPLALIKNLGVPILGPSANFHGEATPYDFNDLNPSLIKLADYVLDGKCSAGNISTVLDCTTQEIKIIRHGAVVINN